MHRFRGGILVIAYALVAATLAPYGVATSLHDRVDLLSAENAAVEAINALRPLGNETPSQAFWRLADLANVTVTNETILPSTAAWILTAPLGLQPGLAKLWGGIEAAQTRLNLSLADLNDTEREQLLRDARPAIQAAHNTTLGQNTTSDDQLIATYRSLGTQTDLKLMAQAQLALLRSTEEALDLLDGVGPFPSISNPQCASGPIVFELAGCTVVVGNVGSNTYTTNALLVLDLGGQDTYRNNAGGASLKDLTTPGGVAVTVDLRGDGDAYHTNGTHLAAQGGGCLGVGLLVDQGGSDIYNATSSATCFPEATPIQLTPIAAQGAGFIGAGALWDICTAGGGCNDTYKSLTLAQGTGIIGFGLLLDEDGSDTYEALPSLEPEAAQGTGCVGGFGALLDRVPTINSVGSNDAYAGSTNDMQGFGCLGGFGLLWDGAGDDSYLLKSSATQSGWGQGLGELGGLGILFEQAGNDTYEAQVLTNGTFEGRFVQGAGSAGIGMLLDLDGTDRYTAQLQAQAWGGIGGTGILYDVAGDDVYSADDECQGFGFQGVGHLLELGGTQDTYDCGEPAHNCVTNAPIARDDGVMWCAGLQGVGDDRAS